MRLDVDDRRADDRGDPRSRSAAARRETGRVDEITGILGRATEATALMR
jgi:hypothetical protein